MSPTPINQVPIDPQLPVMGPVLPAGMWDLIAVSLNSMPSRLAPLDAVQAAQKIQQRIMQTAVESQPTPRAEDKKLSLVPKENQ